MKTTVRESSTLFEFLIRHYPDSPRTRVKKLLKSGAVIVNDRPVTLHSFPLNTGDIVLVNTHQGVPTAAKLPFPVIYEDNDVIVIDKPAGISTSSTDGSNSIQKIITAALRDNSKGKGRAFVVHRLDKEVSGVLLLSKSAENMNRIKDSWKETEKHYYALVEGTPPEPEGTIKSWLIEDRSQKMHSTFERDEARFAVTRYKVIKSVNKCTLLDVETETGRKNQIRVHLSDLGCPIVGDRKYGASDDYRRRVRLHACRLSFPHPVTGKVIKAESPMPEGFLELKPKDEHYKTPLYSS